ncbi:MAG TPA: ABC transporter permease [Candidatus Sabulitectum sp.]|nr:ABC transporter permease [Candidatus Sabulitectum sp.]HPF31873.1 ABC transporter permease [Candidatus Sabulitectum sp.]HPR22445.1 ABC transporter permease [Candidatus Sabulitectum sp.]
MKARRLRFMLKKELLQTFRDPRMRMVILVVPVFQTLVFGYAVTTDVNRVETAIVDLASSPESRSVIRDFTASGIFVPTVAAADFEEAWAALDQGEVQAMLFFDPRGNIQVVTDGSRGISSGVTAGYASEILSSRSASPVELRSRAWYNPLLESRNFYVPGVIAMMVMVITLILSSMAVVREKEIGTMEQIMVTPIKRWEFIVGKTLPFAAIGMVNVLVVSAVAVLWFRIPLQGSIPLLMLASALYLMNTLGMGLFISTVSSTQQQAMLSSFFFIFPATLLSGFAFPIENMPGVIRALTLFNPVRYMMTVLREIFLKGNGLETLWPQFLALLLLGSVLLTGATMRFRKTS